MAASMEKGKINAHTNKNLLLRYTHVLLLFIPVSSVMAVLMIQPQLAFK